MAFCCMLLLAGVLIGASTATCVRSSLSSKPLSSDEGSPKSSLTSNPVHQGKGKLKAADPARVIYVNSSSKIVHKRHNCSGMGKDVPMQAVLCKKCFPMGTGSSVD